MTKAVIDNASFETSDIESGTVSYESLVDAGVNPDVATALRDEYSLPWSTDPSADLRRRAIQVRGFSEAEAVWVVASAGEWDDALGTGGAPGVSVSGVESEDRVRESRWHRLDSPIPVSTLVEVPARDVTRLRDAGITSVGCLSRIHVDKVARVLGYDRETVRKWRDSARLELVG